MSTTSPTPAAPLTIFCNHRFPEDAANDLLARGVAQLGHRLVLSRNVTTSNLTTSAADDAIAHADIAFGQPEPQSLMNATRIRWAHLTTAGYERYDRPEVRQALAARGAILTTSSTAYAEPCAQHALAMILALARQLPAALDAQRDPTHPWPAAEIRRNSRLLNGQTVVILSYGAIARRLIELLAPLRMNVIVVRRNPTGREGLPAVAESNVDSILPQADHVVSILPGGAATRNFLSTARLALLKPTAIVYNIGRGTTLDAQALEDALRAGRLAAAYLDVFDPEPLPPAHPLWTCPHCYITPHTAGGHHDEFLRVAQHFLDNLHRFTTGQEPRDRVM